MEWNTVIVTVTVVTTVLLLQVTCKDEYMTCVYSKSCLLPCTFIPASEEVIHWYYGDRTVYSFYHKNEQLNLQDSHYKNRTTLYKENTAKGNASLQLKPVWLQDRGRYKCYTSTILDSKESFVEVIVEAPIRSVDIQKKGENITCATLGVYPEIRVFWSTDPPTGSETLQPSTQITVDPRGLYSVHSSVGILGNVSDHAYICSFAYVNGTPGWMASLRSKEVNTETGHIVTLTCDTPAPTPQNAIRTWTFRGMANGSSEIILTHQDGVIQPEISKSWQDWVLGLLKNGSLQLHHLQVEKHNGMYTCTLTGSRTTQLVITEVSITSVGSAENTSDKTIIVPVVIGVIIVTVVAIVTVCLRRQNNVCTCNTGTDTEERVTEPMNEGMTELTSSELSAGQADNGPSREDIPLRNNGTTSS